MWSSTSSSRDWWAPKSNSHNWRLRMKCWHTCHTAFCCNVQPVCRLWSLQEMENEAEACIACLSCSILQYYVVCLPAMPLWKAGREVQSWLWVSQHSVVVCDVSADNAAEGNGKWCLSMHGFLCLFVLNCSILPHDCRPHHYRKYKYVACLSFSSVWPTMPYRKWRVKCKYVACLSFSSVWPTMPLQEVESEVQVCGLFVLQHSAAVCVWPPCHNRK